MISGAQIRAARALLGITATELSAKSGVGWATIQRYESGEGAQSRARDSSKRIQTALEAAGIRFIGDPLTSPGVQLRIMDAADIEGESGA